MKLQETNNYVCILDTPSTNIGTVIESEDNLEILYPKVYLRIYKFEGYTTSFVLGDTIWRVSPKSYSEPKSVSLTVHHLNCDFEVFPTKEACEQHLAEKDLKTEKKYKQSSIYQALESIVVLSTIKDFDSLSFAEIKRKLETINNQANIAFKQLKNND